MWKVYFESYGCASNRCDVEVMLGCVVRAGYSVTEDLDEADVVVINTCAVKTPTESRMLNRIRVLKGAGKPIVVAGCLPKINLSGIRKVTGGEFVVLDPQSIDRIVEAVEVALTSRGECIIFSERPPVKPSLPKVRLNPIVEVVQIAEGCVGSCTYCCTRFARGRIHSYPIAEIVDRVSSSVRDGVKEVWLTGQDVGAYGIDLGVDVTDLLEAICELDGEFIIRLGMMNPNRIKRIKDRLAEIYSDEKVFKFLHIPVQSGDDKVLRDMNRWYSVNDFIELVEYFRDKVPEISIATDVICGFPTETDKAFDNTLKLISDVKPDVLNISKFFPRPKTPLWRKKTLPYKLVKSRSRRMAELFRRISLERNMRWVGWKGETLIDEKGVRESWIGRNFAYKPIVVRSSDNLLGEKLYVKVTKACPTHLEGEIVK